MELNEIRIEQLKLLGQKLADAFKRAKESFLAAWGILLKKIKTIPRIVEKRQDNRFNPPIQQTRTNYKMQHQVIENKPRYMMRKIIY
ncbi:Uncharacterised protein [Niallia circulans]|uniref:hypothetical protein n=1 Tax=Niallia circulans TaxID=1397 RepID=UPI00077CA560|nr:hypothetical protein [Niallia circulans]MDR4315001.1 hypothetical protein [Niallia circulans]MED3839725.1 hypothetical protein [Niallia circulans]MED4241210.1 hypothetical protein [Niallia circulans]MED4247871.1 hypothetical protein [Niallia circulans]QKH61646.1 hypothetical protein FOC77_13800 [Niallia circulans]